MPSAIFAWIQHPLSAALGFQAVSLLVGVASVPLFLAFLSNGAFLAWILIATLGSLTIQAEQGIQAVAVRRLAFRWHSSDRQGFSVEVTAIRRKLRLFSVAVIVGLGVAGFIYFGRLTSPPDAETWFFTLSAFMLSYGLNYWFGVHGVILLATQDTRYVYVTNSATRSVNFLLNLFFLWLGLSIVGLALSFLISVALSVLFLRGRSLRRTRGFYGDVAIAHCGAAPGLTVAGNAARRVGRTVTYTAYTLSNFCLYKGAFLLFPLLPGSDNISGYGLALQLVAIVYTISILPTQVWLDQMVKAVLDYDLPRVKYNLLGSLAFIFATFGVVFLAVLVLARPALDVISSQIYLPRDLVLTLLFFGFLVEAVIFVLVNVLLLLGDTRFLWRYISGVLIALSLSSSLQMVRPDFGITSVFLLVPVALQTLATLPVGLWYVAKAVKRMPAAKRSSDLV